MAYLNARQAAARADVHHATIVRWVQDGKLPSSRLSSGLHQIDEADLEAHLSMRTVTPRARPGAAASEIVALKVETAELRAGKAREKQLENLVVYERTQGHEATEAHRQLSLQLALPAARRQGVSEGGPDERT